MNKKTFILTFFLLIFATAFSSYAYAFDVSIDRVKLNGAVVAESRSNLINDADVFAIAVDFTAVDTLEKGHVEAVLRGRQSGSSVSNSTSTFDLDNNRTSSANLTLVLIDRLKREKEFDLTIKVVDVHGSSEEKTYGIKTKETRLGRALDVSIDTVRVNSKIVAASTTNFIEGSDDFDVLVQFTALEDLKDTHVEAILKDLRTGTVVADASSNFDLMQDSNSSRLLRLELLDKLKKSNSFELTVRIVNADGDAISQIYGVGMRDRGGVFGSLDLSIDSVEVESKSLTEDKTNIIFIGEGRKNLGLRVGFTAREKIEKARIEAVLTFENGDSVSDKTTSFDMAKKESITKKLELPLIANFQEGNFNIKIRFVDTQGNSAEKSYDLRIREKNLPFIIKSLSLDPETNIQAGKNLLATVSFKNIAIVSLQGIDAKISIPELDISSAKSFAQIKDADKLAEISEEFILKIPDSVQTGTYTLRSEVVSNLAGESDIMEVPIYVVGKSEQPKQIPNEKIVINLPIAKQDLYNDGSEVVYPLTLTNQGPYAKTYTILLDGSNWANLRLSESSAFVIKPKESKTVNIYTSSNGNLIGERTFLVKINSDDRILKEISIKGNVVAVKSKSNSAVTNTLEILIAGFVILLLGFGLFFGIKKLMKKVDSEKFYEEIPDQSEGESYY